MAKKNKADMAKEPKEKISDEETSEKLKDENENESGACEDCGNGDEYSKLKTEYDVLNNKMLRLQADFLNYKTRTEKEKTSTYSNAASDVLTDLLPIIDNFERAIDAINSENQEVINFKNGVKMIYDQFISSLQKRGLKEIEALNSKFDPNIHSGIAFEVTEDKEEDTVIEVFQKGYMVNDRVIRPSMVKIAKK